MQIYCNSINYLVQFSLDGDRGTPSNSVDIQRNRILATAALKNAEPLADQGKYTDFDTTLYISTAVTTDMLCKGKLQDAQKILMDAIDTIEKSQSAKDTFCQVS